MLRRSLLLPVVCVVAAAVTNSIAPQDECTAHDEKIHELEKKLQALDEENQKLKADLEYVAVARQPAAMVKGKEEDEPVSGVICLANRTTLELWNGLLISLLNITTCQTSPGEPEQQYECSPKSSVPIR